MYETLYIIGYDSVFDKTFDSGVRVMSDNYLIDRVLRGLYASSTSAEYKVVKELPEGVKPYGS